MTEKLLTGTYSIELNARSMSRSLQDMEHVKVKVGVGHYRKHIKAGARHRPFQGQCTLQSISRPMY